MNNQKKPGIRRFAWPVVLCFILCVSVHSVRSQTSPTSSSASGAASAVNAATGEKTDETIQLTAFEVVAVPDNSYGALNSNSITRFNAELDKLPISADILTEALMRDSGLTSVQDLIQNYSAGAGFSGSDAGGTAALNQPGDRPSGSIQLRGLQGTSYQRDGLMPTSMAYNGIGYTNTWDLERIEIINGPQALLYGNGGAGGVINLVSKQARLGKKPFGSVKLQVDQYGGNLAQFEYGFGNDRVAARFSILEQGVSGRRDYIGGRLHGYYGQVAFKLFGNTIVRLSGEQTTYDRIVSSNLTVTAASTANDTRNGQFLHYLLATNQVNGSATGASGAGNIANGNLNWDNVDSFAGWWGGEINVNELGTLSIETQWNRWLSTQLSVAYDTFSGDRANNVFSFLAPNNTANPLGVWAMSLAGSNPGNDQTYPGRTKAIRFSMLANNSFFGDRAKSQTIVGADFWRIDGKNVLYDYYQADSNFNVIVNPSSTVNNGRTVMPRLFWSVANGPTEYPLWRFATPRVTYNGVNYVRQIVNQVNPALISATNPLGVTPGGAVYSVNKNISRGLFAVNYTQWFDGKLDTMIGFRYGSSFQANANQGVAPPAAQGAMKVTSADTFSFNVGAAYKATRWLTPYFAVSDSANAPTQQNDPYGNVPGFSKALGEEVGVKVSNREGTVSGSIAVYHVNSKNEQYSLSSTFVNAINPNGLNGTYGAPSSWINVDRKSQGVQVALTASPSSNWRARLSGAVIDGKVGSNTSYAQLYNDQFYSNSGGQVTYKDGSNVFVLPTFTSSRPTVPAGTVGAIPLTIAMMNTPGNPYYANPVAVSGAINSGSAVATVLRAADPAHGPILTGATGLPISAQQISPSFTPPGAIVTSVASEKTVGYPKLAVNLTNVYTVPTGWLKGLQFGGTVAAAWYQRTY